MKAWILAVEGLGFVQDVDVNCASSRDWTILATPHTDLAWRFARQQDAHLLRLMLFSNRNVLVTEVEFPT